MRVQCTWLGTAPRRGLKASLCQCPPVSASCRGRPLPPSPLSGATPASGSFPASESQGPASQQSQGPCGTARSRLGRLEALASAAPHVLSCGARPCWALRSSSGYVHGPPAAPLWSLLARGGPRRTRCCVHPSGSFPPLWPAPPLLSLPRLAVKCSASLSLKLSRFRTRRVGMTASLLPVTYTRGSDRCLRFCRPRPSVHCGTTLTCRRLQCRAGPRD